MDAHDQELLDRQLRAIYQPPRPAGVIVVGIVAIFLGGMIAGSFLTTSGRHTSANSQMAYLNIGNPVTRN